MNDKDAKRLADKMLSESRLIEPGTEMFVIIHTDDEGLVPPPLRGTSGEGGFEGEGKGDAHCFGPFTSRDEATEWQRVADVVRPCDCRKALIEVLIPRILALVGPPGIPISADDLPTKDWLN